MGQSPSAAVYWGYDLKDMTDETWDSLKPSWMRNDEDDNEERDFEEELATRLGWVAVPFPPNAPEYPRYTGGRDAYDAAMRAHREADELFRNTDVYALWRASRAEMRALVKGYPIELATYGYVDEPMYYVCVRESTQRVGDWGSKPLEPIVTDGAWHIKLTAFMQMMELPVPDGPPCWYLNCSYG